MWYTIIMKKMLVRHCVVVGCLLLLVPLARAVAPSPMVGHYGALVTPTGVSFRVWAPHATSVSLAGTFNSWSSSADRLAPDDATSNYWSIFRSSTPVGALYKFVVNGTLWKADPWTRAVAYPDGNAVVTTADYAWTSFVRPHESETVLYELHVGTFNGGTFAGVAQKAAYLQRVGINAVELMPPAEFSGSRSWGYNPVGIYAPESAYGGVTAFKQMVDVLHQHGIAVYIDVVYNHVEGEILWKWDGWTMGSHVCPIDGQTGEHGGIFYFDWTGSPAERWYTQWGKNRPNYARAEVTNYLTQNIVFWLTEMNCDGIRMDSTINMRKVNYSSDIPEGYALCRTINTAADVVAPDAVLVAEDLNDYTGVTDKSGGAYTLGFDAQWNNYFVDNVRNQMKISADASRDMTVLQNAVQSIEHGRAFATVKYSDSHDDAANGQSRLNVEIDPPNGNSYFAKKRSTLAAALVLTAPGIPMLFQGQEFLEDGFFSDTDPLDWTKANTYGGMLRLYRDVVHLRRDAFGISTGLTGAYVSVYHVNNAGGVKLMAYRRARSSSAGDDVIVVVNAANTTLTDYQIGLPGAGTWYCLVNSDRRCYDAGYGNGGSLQVEAGTPGMDGLTHKGSLTIAPYSFMVFGRALPAAPTAAFSATPTNGNRGLAVRFTDMSSGLVTNWLWNFGDGSCSTEVNPLHRYTNDGLFTVTMTIAGLNGNAQAVQSNAIHTSSSGWIDGQNIPDDFADAEAATFQDTVTDWGAWNALLAARATLETDRLLLGVSGSIEKNGNGLVVFFDSIPGVGTNRLTPALNGVAARIVNMTGMVFDAEFTPDFALNIHTDSGNPAEARVDFSRLNANTYSYWGKLQTMDTSYGAISNAFAQLALYNQSAAGTSLAVTGTYATGLELAITRAALDLTGECCRVQVVVSSSDGKWSANQSLAPIHGATNSYAASGSAASKRYDLVPGEQFLQIGVPEPLGLQLGVVLYMIWNKRPTRHG